MLKAPNPNFAPQDPRGICVMINPPLEQLTRSYNKRGCFNSRGCRSGRANVDAIFGEKEANRQDKENDRAQVYVAIKYQGKNHQFVSFKHQHPMRVRASSYSLILAVLILSFLQNIFAIFLKSNNPLRNLLLS